MTKKRIIYSIFIILWMIIIFYFSSQNGVESQYTSDIFTKKIMSFLKISDSKIVEQTNEIISFIVRKSAHFLIYFFGGFFIYGFMNTYELPKKKIVYYSIMFGFLYAITDEIHQHFIPGRSMQIKDVFIDTFGIILMIFLCTIKDVFGDTFKIHL